MCRWKNFQMLVRRGSPVTDSRCCPTAHEGLNHSKRVSPIAGIAMNWRDCPNRTLFNRTSQSHAPHSASSMATKSAVLVKGFIGTRINKNAGRHWLSCNHTLRENLLQEGALCSKLPGQGSRYNYCSPADLHSTYIPLIFPHLLQLLEKVVVPVSFHIYQRIWA